MPRLTPADPWRPSWMPWAIVGFVVSSSVLVVAYLVAPELGTRQMLFFVNQLLATVLFAVGARTSRRGFRRDWWLMCGAVVVWFVGLMLTAFDLDASGMPQAWVGSVVLSSFGYVLMTVGAIRLARRDGFVRGAAVGLDGGVLGSAVLLVWWLYVGQALFTSGVPVTPERITAGVTPLGDALLLVGAWALTNSRAANSLSARGLILAAATGLVGDFGFARLMFEHPTVDPVAIPALWMVQFSSAAVAALASGRPAAREQREMRATSILVLILAVVVPPLLALKAAVHPTDAVQVGWGTLGVLAAGTVGTSVLLAVRGSTLLRRIHDQAADLERTARTDDLTQLPNRRAGDRILAEAVVDAHEARQADTTADTGTVFDGPGLHVAILDLDHFKQVNDTYGHQEGDRVLRAAAHAWSTALDDRGTLFRYGGEEFVVILPDTTPDEATTIVDDLRLSTPTPYTFSAGLVRLRHDDDAHSLLSRADDSLYRAKSAGRDRTVAA